MKNHDVIILNYLKDKNVKNKTASELRETIIDRIPISTISGVWYHLILETLDSVDWFAIEEFLNNEKYNTIKQIQEQS